MYKKWIKSFGNLCTFYKKYDIISVTTLKHTSKYTSRGDIVIKKEMIAMLLAGGQGSRLGVLTQKVAKPAVSFGGKYRIIDFPLSNCINSGVDTVGVLTQYQPLRLNAHIGIGIPWDLDRNVGGVTVLPPYERSKGSDWYTGTANAIYQNLEYMENYNPDYVLILSGDHIYKMDYEVMLEYHKANNADITIAAMPVPIEEASRFGIMNTEEDDKIYEFEEKPAKPKSNYCVTGLYFYDNKVVEYAKNLKPSARGELEITDLNRIYLENGDLDVILLGQGFTWLDTGTHESLVEATNFVKTVETHQHRKIACLEEIAYLNGWITKEQVLETYEVLKKNQYGKYLKDVLDGKYVDKLHNREF